MRLGGVEEHKAATEIKGGPADASDSSAQKEPPSSNRLVAIDDKIQGDSNVQLRKQPTTVIEEDHTASVGPSEMVLAQKPPKSSSNLNEKQVQQQTLPEVASINDTV